MSFSKTFSQQYPLKFNHLTVDEGLSHTDANEVAQDKAGYIWVATHFGLNRFDGYTIKKFYNSNVPLNNAYRNRIMCLYPDETGNIWLGTEGGIQAFDSKTEHYNDYPITGIKTQPTFGKLIRGKDNYIYGLINGQFRYFLIREKGLEEQRPVVPADVRFSDMVADQAGDMYLSSNKGAWIFNKSKGFKNVIINGWPDKDLSRIFITHDQDLLIATQSQLLLTHREKAQSQKALHESAPLNIEKTYTFPAGLPIKRMQEDGKGNFWIFIPSELICLDSKLAFIQEMNGKNAPASLTSVSITNIYIDRSQCLWVCTFGGGVNYCDLNEKKFYTLRNNTNLPNSLSGNHIRSIFEDDQKKLWVGTKNNGLNACDLNTGQISYFNTRNSTIKLKSDDITALTMDNDHNLWIGSGGGIDIYNGKLNKLWKAPGSENFPTYTIETLAKDCYGNMWFGNHSNPFGVIWRDEKGFFRVRYYGEGYFIFPNGKNPELFVSSTHGLKRLIVDKTGNITKTYDYQAGEGPNSLSSNYTYSVRKQNDSTYWIGTIGGGLNRMILRENNSYTITSYTGDKGVFNDVESLEIDTSGTIWMGGNGLQCLDPTTGKLIRYDKNDGLQGNSFKVGASYKGSGDRLFFGGINGLNYFYPGQIKTNQVAAHPVLTGLMINNEPPDLAKVWGYADSLRLTYRQNNFVISFSAMHYANPLKCRFRYKLIGYDNEWKFTDGKNPTATYSNLDYSNYTFIVEATNNDGSWSSASATLSIIVAPPWYKSPAAKWVYCLLVITSLAGIYIYQARWYRLKRELAIRAINEKRREEMHKQREELHQQQLQFFTNISHEFRTPLTLLLSPLEKLITGNKDAEVNSSYQLMFRNVKRLINLINELMNFKKVADSAIRLQLQPLAINSFCKSLYAEFADLATGKDIDFKLVDHTLVKEAAGSSNLFDLQIVEKILFNLLNNAFKYTNHGGQVRLEVSFDREDFHPSFKTEFHLANEEYRANKYIYFLIADTGIGISHESISKIFDRYYRVSNSHLGSGVGLALVKSLTRLHKGEIFVYSQRYKGTEIIVALPWGHENYTNEEISSHRRDETLTQIELIDNSELTPAINAGQDNGHEQKKLPKYILLVEDNSELRSFLAQTLGKHYFVYEAENGDAAFEIACNKSPDLIISDVMMPGMSGVELCRQVKEQFETSHIPFIILSAKDALETKIESLEYGADYYFAKPLSIDLLLLTVHNIFEQSLKLKQKYTNDYLSDATELVHSGKDKEFMKSLLELIEANIEDPDLDVDFLCNRMFISRTKLYHKIKSISNQSVGEFIKTIRLKKAIQLMTHEHISLADVAYRIGLQNPAYFSRVFKKEFDKSPTEYMQSLRNNTNADRKK